MLPIADGSGGGANGIAVQTDQKIVVAGSCIVGGFVAFCVARLNADGSLDQSFNASAPPAERGTRVAQWPAGGYPAAMLLQPDQKIVQAGTCSDGSIQTLCALRLASDGSVDTSFNGTGWALAPSVSGQSSQARALALHPDGKLVLAGMALAAQQRYAVVRFNSGGTLDTAFGSGGTASAVLGLYGGSPNAITVQPDGRILVAGNCFAETGGEFCALRLRADGSFDPSLGGNGRWVAPITSQLDTAYSALFQPDGKLLLAGNCSYPGYGFCAARYGVSCSMDIDGDGSVLGPTDALLFMRVALGMTGSAVTGGINFPAAATRTDWAAIRDHLANNCGMTVAP